MTSGSKPDNNYDTAPWADWRQGIRGRLNESRPPRYDASDRDWMEGVIGWAAQTMPNQHKAIRIHAESEVYKLEGLATKKANQEILRYADGHKPLLWSEFGALPFRVENTRVRLDAGTPEDFELAAQEQRADGKAAYERVITRAATLEELAGTARHLGVSVVSKIGDLPQRIVPEGTAAEDYPDLDDDLDW